MPSPLVYARARTLAVLLVASVVATLALAVVAQRSMTSNVGAATAGIVHIEMKITGQKTGVFKGDSTQKGHEDEILVSSYLFEVTAPHDPASGQATGKRVYKPITITKQLNSSSPQILNALVTNENLKTVVIDFFKTDKTGKEFIYYRVTLTDARITSDKQYSSGDTVSEDVAFTFFKITQEDLVNKTVFTDDWSANVS